MTSRSSTSVVLPSSAREWTVIAGLPGSWRRLRTRLAVSACASDDLVVDGRLVDGLQILHGPDDDAPSSIVVAGRSVVLVDDGLAVVRVRAGCC